MQIELDKEVQETQLQLDTLYNWGLKNGAFLSNIKLTASISTNNTITRTATSTTTIPSLEPLFSTPHHLRISEKLCRQSNAGQLLQKHLSSDTSIPTWNETSSDPLVLGVLFMITYLLVEKSNPESFWSAYIESLPKDVSSLPITWSDTLLAKTLSGTQLLSITNHRKKLLLSGFESVKIALKEHLDFSYEAFIWCYCMVSSRAFPDLEIQDQVCLYPILDILDHSPDTKITWFHSLKETQFIHHSKIEKGVILLNNYGQKGNQNLLSNYGFVIDGNRNDYFVLGLGGLIKSTMYLKVGVELNGLDEMDNQSFCDLWNVVGEQFFKLKDSCSFQNELNDLDPNEWNARIYRESQMEIFKFHMLNLKVRFEKLGKVVHVADLKYSKKDKEFFSNSSQVELPEESLLALALTDHELESFDIPALDIEQTEDMEVHFMEDIQPHLIQMVSSRNFCLAANFVQENMIVLESNVLRYIGSKRRETVIVILK